jgi:hypothetical protein
MRGPHRESFINSFDTYGDKVTGFVEQNTRQPVPEPDAKPAERPPGSTGQTP